MSNEAEVGQAIRDGAAAAILDCTPGNYFRSAHGAARETKHQPGSLLFKLFVQGYLSECPSSVSVDVNGMTMKDPAHCRLIGVGLIDSGYGS